MYVSYVTKIKEYDGFIIIDTQTEETNSNDQFASFDRFVFIENDEEGEEITMDLLKKITESRGFSEPRYLLEITEGKKFNIHWCRGNGRQYEYREIENKIKKGELNCQNIYHL